ncbi:nucleotidyltransferase domain-containing protein [Candidatus Pacearchaeota archaeon]|nr:nucleotidyltransferase domain-containing protein [Candidatus Pacearchaeota archaeon]
MEKMLKRNEIIAYALDFASYLLSKLENGEINRIILHGSVARGDFDEESDIDLFIDINDIKFEKRIAKLLENYYKTNSYKEWELKGLTNEISLISGKLDSDEWKDLKRAIMNTGIMLYGKYKSDIEKVKHYTIFSFENIKPDSKRVSIFRKIFGFKIGKKKYPGMAEKINAIKLGKGDILVPIEHTLELKKFFQEKKVSVKLYDVWMD